MTWRIIRRVGSRQVEIQLSPRMGWLLREMATLTSRVVKNQDRERWEQAAPGFLDEIKKGSLVLESMGSHPTVQLSDMQAHLCLHALCFMTLQLRGEPLPELLRLVAILQMLAEACPCRLVLGDDALPPISKIRCSTKWNNGVRQLYRDLRSKENRKLPLADCCRLLIELPEKSRDDLPSLILELWRVTAPYREALNVLLGSKL